MYNKDEKIIIRCRKCSQKLRIPKDAGKIAVTCPMCRTEFIVDSKDILFRITAGLGNTLDTCKKSIAGMKTYGDVLQKIWRQIGGRYKK